MQYHVTVKPNSSQEKIITDTSGDNFLTVYTHASAHDGEANVKVIKLLAKYFKVPKTSITIVRGAKSHQKVIEIP